MWSNHPDGSGCLDQNLRGIWSKYQDPSGEFDHMLLTLELHGAPPFPSAVTPSAQRISGAYNISRRPKMAPRQPTTAPRQPKTAPRQAKTAPRPAKTAPKTAPREEGAQKKRKTKRFAEAPKQTKHMVQTSGWIPVFGPYASKRLVQILGSIRIFKPYASSLALKISPGFST